MDTLLRLNGSQFCDNFLQRLSRYLEESDLYCFARTCTFFWQCLRTQLPFRVHVSEYSFQSLDVLDFLRQDSVLQDRSYYYVGNAVYKILPESVEKYVMWMMNHLYCNRQELLRFVVINNCPRMVKPVVDYIHLLH